MTLALALALAGLLAGFVHVLSGPDHLAAIAPYAVEGKTRAWKTGVRWGMGHSAGVLGVGLLALLARHALSLEALSAWAERGVGIVLIGIGAWGLRKALALRSHDVSSHIHGREAFTVGTVHGLAGSSHLLGVLPALGEYTTSKLRAAGIDVRLRTKVAAFDGRTLSLDCSSDAAKPSPLPARTLIWTAGVAPSPLIEALSLAKERGRIVVDETLAVPGHEGVWACGDCAAVPGPQGKPYPGTAQHAVRQGMQAGRNIAAALRGQRSKIHPFRYQMIGQFAAIGRHRAVATLFGLRFSGFIAWLMWRGAYLLMLPRLNRKIRVLLEWILEICFARDTVQLRTAESVRSRRVEELMDSARAADSAERVPQP
jgi:NADH dehydrogenase FAD-containing subunit